MCRALSSPEQAGDVPEAIHCIQRLNQMPLFLICRCPVVLGSTFFVAVRPASQAFAFDFARTILITNIARNARRWRKLLPGQNRAEFEKIPGIL